MARFCVKRAPFARMRPRHVLAQAGIDDVEQLAVADDAAAPAAVAVGALTLRTIGRGDQRVRQPAPVHEVGAERVAPVRGPGQPRVPVRSVARVVLEEHVVLAVPDERQRIADVPGLRLVVEGGSEGGVGHARASCRGCRRHARPLQCAPEENLDEARPRAHLGPHDRVLRPVLPARLRAAADHSRRGADLDGGRRPGGADDPRRQHRARQHHHRAHADHGAVERPRGQPGAVRVPGPRPPHARAVRARCAPATCC